jgi:alpha-beta hydrolase superfamily lysophospholipase
LTINKHNKDKLIVFSHGLGAHLNASTSMFYNWVSPGYTVLSINHDKDEISPDYRTVSTTDHDLIRKFLFARRNRDLNIRVSEITAVLDKVQ